MRPFGFNVIGHVSANAGMGVTARNVVRVLLNRGFPVALLDVDPGRGRGGHDLTYESLTVKSPDELPYAVNLSVLSITALPDFVIDRPGLLGRDTLNAGFYVWELAVLPDVWKRALECYDVLVAESDFIRSTFANVLSNVPTISASHPMSFPNDVKAERARFGIGDELAFVCIVDPTSDPARKNPFAAIDAFRAAFAESEQVSLVVRINNAKHDGNVHPLVPGIRAHCASDPRIRLIEESLTYRDVLSLYASADVFVSLHRSEGFGLGPLEAMVLGKPVIATGWSGNMTYMTHDNACVCRYKLIPVEGSLRVYTEDFLGTEALWADPDVEDASRWMKRLAQDKDLRIRLGAAAAKSAAEFMQRGEEARFADELVALWEARSAFPSRPPISDAEIAQLREMVYEQTASTAEIVAHKARKVLDRHVLWRLKRS